MKTKITKSLVFFLLLVGGAVLVLCAPYIRNHTAAILAKALARPPEVGAHYAVWLNSLFWATLLLWVLPVCFYSSGHTGLLKIAALCARVGNHLQHASVKRTRLACVFVFGCFVFLNAWQSDDAYHSHVMSRNLAEGFGLVYNIGERVSATTCPLWTIVVAGLYKLFGEVYFTSIFLGTVLSASAFWILLGSISRRSGEKTNLLFVSTTAMLLLTCSFVAFATSGLENSLLFFLFALFLDSYLKNDRFDARQMFVLSLLASFIAMTRMDNILFAALPLLHVFFFMRRENATFLKMFLAAGAGFFPFVLWELFSILYYGFPFPNTAYAKVGAGFPHADYILRGAEYFLDALLRDAWVLLLPALFLLAAFFAKSARLKILAAGVILYNFYLLNVGGDFMTGRHFAVGFFISVFSLAVAVSQSAVGMKKENDGTFSLLAGEKTFRLTPARVRIAQLCFFVLLTQSVLGATYSLDFGDLAPTGKWVFNIRRGRIEHTSVVRQTLARLFPEKFTVKLTDAVDVKAEPFEKLRSAKNKGDILRFAPGIWVYHMTERRYVNDIIGLGDPLIVRLRGHYEARWHTGHIMRDIPAGYRDSVRTGENHLKDPNLRKYLDILREVTRDEKLFSSDRLKKILALNTGKYKHLLEAYENGQHETEEPLK
jgi:arabinofuranosyltransferase